MYWHSITYQWGGGVVPHVYCDSPGHAQNTKKCLRVDQPLLQLPVKFQLHTLSQKFFRDKCVRSIVIRSDDVPPMRVYGENTESTFFVIISRQLVGFSQNLVEMFFSTIPMQCPSQNSKFENLRQFIGRSEPPWWMGGVLYRTFAGMIGHDRKKDFSIFFFHNKGKGKNRTYPKEFFKNIKKIARKSIFPNLAVQPPPHSYANH